MPSKFPHATIVKSTKDGRTFFRLVCRDQNLCNFFDTWSFSLAKNSSDKSFRTVKAYARAVLRFVNYFLEAEDQLNGSISNLDLYALLDNYESYLAYGADSEVDLIRKIAEKIPTTGIGGSTIAQEMTGLNNFLKESEKFRIAVMQMEEAGHISPSNMASNPLIEMLGSSTPSQAVKAAVRESSWLAGCLSGGMKTIKKANLKPQSKASEVIVADEFGGDERAFPYDLVKSLINSAPNLRDKTLWSLIAASGIRISEAQTMFESDVVIETVPKTGRKQHGRRIASKKVFVIDPETRKQKLRRYLTESEIRQLPHKGRKEPDTYLIEPFASMFWKSLAEYKASENKKEKLRGVRAKHPFLFRSETTGEPLTHSYQTLYEQFSAAAKKVMKANYGEERSYGFHSLRHMYAYYVHNLAPTGDGTFGLPLKQVQLLLGHANIKSTQRYAREDFMMLEVTLGALNMAQMTSEFFSVDKVRLEFLKSKVAEIEARMAEDEDEERMLTHD